jgi:hypothetical protein
MIRHVLSTLAHKFLVARYLIAFAVRLTWRALVHDASKLGRFERAEFARVLPFLRGTTYGTQAYRHWLDELGPALRHHYRANSHHPEHHDDGVAGMDLLDLVEMFCDWRAAVRRHADGDIVASVEHNVERFTLGPTMAAVLRTEAKR